MDTWNPSIVWWLVSGVLVLAELTTGTFYLLMLALGTASGALAAGVGLGHSSQMLVAAAVGGGAVVAWRRHRSRRPAEASPSRNRDVNLDVGEHVQVSTWQPDGRTLVQYRGSTWQARLEGPGQPAPGEHVIVAVESNHLVISPCAK